MHDLYKMKDLYKNNMKTIFIYITASVEFEGGVTGA